MNKLKFLDELEERFLNNFSNNKYFKRISIETRGFFERIRWEEYSKLYKKLYKYFSKKKYFSQSERIKDFQLEFLKESVDKILYGCKQEDRTYSKLELAEREFVIEKIEEYKEKHLIDFPN